MEHQGTLTCPFCTKSFPSKKQSTRHVRYCRTKAKDGALTRRRCCATCIKAKTRCDMGLPGCSRCTHKGLQCLYKSSKAPCSLPVDRQVEVALSHNDLPKQGLDGSPKHISIGRGTSPYDLGQLFEGNNFDHALSINTWPELPSNPGTDSVDETAFSDGMLALVSSDPLSWNSSSNTFLVPQVDKIDHFKDRVVLGSFQIIALSPSFDWLDTETVLAKRDLKAGPLGSTLSRAYCLSMLRSYPEMLCRNGGTLPPFIHIQSRPSTSGDNHTVALAEPLATCSSIMRMYMERSSENLAFIWRTIQAESRRINDEYWFYDTWTTLASIQAMAIYVIVGLLDDNSNFTADKHLLVSMLEATRSLAEKLRPNGWMCNGEIHVGQIPAWEEWAEAESRRRTAILLVVVMHLFNIEYGPGLPQCGGFAELPLPCSKTLWQASDQATWEAEYRKQYMRDDSCGRSFKRILTYRNLLQGQSDPTSPLGTGHLGEWFTNMDDFGTLVMMAVSGL
ncbi:hypothetical protein BKA56DRAFT_592637 [Ilyonectria sp. MPI-CAGE-AT-0026]|nr:hypothetical protein BKA56DRAFT_592637 [Ilyonectria sp. MPI-CAGE-AT-0026]